MAVIVVAAAIAVTCVQTNTATCTDGTVCREGTRCVGVGSEFACATDLQFEVCNGIADGTDCEVGGIPGTCFGGACVIEQCGDRIDIRSEVCDDGNRVGGDGCSSDCRSMEICGDGYADLAAGEQCDQAIKGLSGDGCTSRCSVEYRLWRDVTPVPPEARDYSVFVTDPAGGVLLFGGTTNLNGLIGSASALTPKNDRIWRWDGVTWRELDPRTRPPRRSGAAAAYDSRRRRVVVFGGQGSNGPLADTWEYDGVTWTERTPASGPSARIGATMACDDASGCVMFGGVKPAGIPEFHRDGWRWDGSAWTPLGGTGLPSARARNALAYDRVKQAFVLYGGTGCGSGASCTLPVGLSDTWEYRGGSWMGPLNVNSPLSTFYLPNAAHDATKIFLVAGGSAAANRSTYSYASTGWTSEASAQPPPDSVSEMAYDEARNKLIVLGTLPGLFQRGILMEWLMQGWTDMAPGSPALGAGGAAYDQRRGRVVYLAGDTRTWEWDGRGWIRRGAGPGSAAYRIVYDAVCGTMLAFGGTTSPNSQTWSYDGEMWTQVATTGPAPRFGHALAYDANRDRVVVFGGRPSLGNPTLVLGDVWEWGGACGAKTWTEVTPPTSPSARTASAAAFDPRHGVVLFGGKDAIGATNDTWIWNGATWRPVIAPPALPAPPARSRHAMTYDPRRGRIVMVGGEAQSGFEDTWEWDGEVEGWREVPVVLPAPVRVDAVASADLTGGVVILGGAEPPGSTGPSLVYRLRSEQGLEPIERCVASTDDTDGDGLAGCADPDCYARCAPMCAPGTSCMGPSCGDDSCSSIEDYLICPEDCDPL